jgi:hypothetical protein
MKFEQDFREALTSEQAFITLHGIIRKLLAEGYTKETLYKELEGFRNTLLEEKSGKESAEEDTVMDVMDCLVGWCAPHMKL